MFSSAALLLGLATLTLASIDVGAQMPDAQSPRPTREKGIAADSLLHPQISTNSISGIGIDAGQALYPLTERVTRKFTESLPANAKISVRIERFGGGLERLCRHRADVAETTGAITPRERALCKENEIQYLELPVALDALIVVVNRRSPLTQISIDELRKMWDVSSQRRVNQWPQVNTSFPVLPLKLYAPPLNSNAADYLIQTLLGEKGELREDYIASADDEFLIRGIQRDVAALGMIGLQYYLEARKQLKALAVIPANGTAAVQPSPENIANGHYKPLTRRLSLLVSKKSLSRPEVSAYLEYYLRNASELAVSQHYLPLADAEYQRNLDALHQAVKVAQ